MPFLRTTVLFKLFYPIIILSLLIFSCSTDNSITQSSNEIILEKSSSINSEVPSYSLWPLISFIGFINPYAADDCLLKVELFAPYLLGDDSDNNSNSKYSSLFDNRDEIVDNSYDFRNNYLNINEKGKIYIYCYYKLSEYSIANNIIGKYYKEHLEITPLCIDIAYELQHGNNPNHVPFMDSNFDKLNKMIDIYRNTDNHKEIDIVLDYLETDLEKYYNKAKAEIAADFGF